MMLDVKAVTAKHELLKEEKEKDEVAVAVVEFRALAKKMDESMDDGSFWHEVGKQEKFEEELKEAWINAMRHYLCNGNGTSWK